MEALAVARDVAGAKTIYDFTWLDIVPEILQNNYAEAVRMALLMADSRSASLAELEEGFTEPSEKQRIQKFLDDPQKGTLGMMFVATALAFRLATLLISGTSAEKISIAIQDVIEARPGDSRVENISNALHAGLLEDHSWSDLRTRGESLINTDTAVGLVHYVGSALKRPLAQALTMQVWLAQTAEFTFKGFKSLQRLIIWPFFFAFWSDVVTREPEQFRTSQSYARRQVEMSAEGASSDSVKQLLASMWFCLGVDLSESAKAWLRAR